MPLSHDKAVIDPRIRDQICLNIININVMHYRDIYIQCRITACANIYKLIRWWIRVKPSCKCIERTWRRAIYLSNLLDRATRNVHPTLIRRSTSFSIRQWLIAVTISRITFNPRLFTKRSSIELFFSFTEWELLLQFPLAVILINLSVQNRLDV